MPKPSVLIRVDASTAIGTGHLMRCLSLAHAMRARDWSVTFFTAALPAGFERRIDATKCARTVATADAGTKKDAEETAALALGLKAGWIVLDGYHFDDAYRSTLSTSGIPTLVIDDFGTSGASGAAIILNQNLSARASLYVAAPKTKLLLGTDYVLLAPQFTSQKNAAKSIKKLPERILVTFGGADPKNITLKALQALEEVPHKFSVDVLVGAANPHKTVIQEFARSMRHPTNVIIDADDMAARMQSTDLAIAAAGTTSWELLSQGVPFITGAFADNQKAIADELGRRGLAVNLGWYPDVSQEDFSHAIENLINDAAQRSTFARIGPTIVDGRGAGRVCDALESFLTP